MPSLRWPRHSPFQERRAACRTGPIREGDHAHDAPRAAHRRLSAAAVPGGGVHRADYPEPKRGTYVARDFRFHTGAVLPEVKLSYLTIGNPNGEPVLVLHGQAGSAASMVNPGFAGELFGPGQPLDATKYFIIIPDAIGAGQSSKPSDGMRAAFPRYNYDDMVAGHHRLLTEGLGIRRVRLIIGNSMGGMHAWVWGVTHPDFMDALVPMASQPTEMSSRNWMMRRLIIDSVRNDPDWNNGNYTTQPKALRVANVFYGIATNGGTLAYQEMAPTREAADKAAGRPSCRALHRRCQRFHVPVGFLPGLQSGAAARPHPRPGARYQLGDDERNPPETGIMERELKRIPMPGCC